MLLEIKIEKLNKYIKKIFLLLILLSITGCSNANHVIVDENTSSIMNNYDSQNLLERMNNIRNGLAPKIKSSKKENSNSTITEENIQLENLASQFNEAIIKTNFGDIKVGFYSDVSPLTVNNFLNLAQKDFYNNTKFHRVIKDFMIQGGDPNSKDDDWSNDGIGGPGYKFKDEINDYKLVRGSLAMANSGPNTNGSQFFIITKDATPWLDGKHTNFGYVINGMDVVNNIEDVKINENDHPLEDVVIISIELLSSEFNGEEAMDSVEEY